MKMNLKVYNVIDECYGTDGEFTSNDYSFATEEEAINKAIELVEEMADMMSYTDDNPDFNPKTDWNLYGDGWEYSVRISEQELYI